MKRIIGIGLLAAAMAASGIALAADAPKPANALEIFGHLPTMEGATLSPNGNRLAVIRTEGDNRIVQVVDFASSKQLSTANAGASKVRGITWVDDDNLIITSTRTQAVGESAQRDEYSTATLFNVVDAKAYPLLQRAQTEAERSRSGGGPALAGLVMGTYVRLIDGKRQAYLMGYSYEGRTLYALDTRNGSTRPVVTLDPKASDFLLDANAKVVAEALYDDVTRKGSILYRDKGRVVVPAPEGAEDGVNILGYSADGSKIMVAYETKDRDVVAEVTPGLSDYKILPEYDDDTSPFFDSLTQRLAGKITEKDDVRTYSFVDPADQQAWNSVRAAFKGEIVELQSRSADHQKLLIMADSPKEGPGYVLIDRKTGQGGIIGSPYMGVKASDFSPVKPIKYNAADGTPIAGYLTLPYGKEAAKGLPLIVLVHGGPQARDEPGFDWWSQAMASRGYAVLRVNYRGSEGYGRPFVELGHGQWGRKMQTDVSDGVRYLAKDGVIDPKRVCIVGASYGGYAALAGAALDTGVYRCAASVAGPSDLSKMIAWSRDEKGRGAYRYWNKFMGVEGVRDPDLRDISPASHAAAVTIPLLMIHGKDDTVVPYEQSVYMANAMRAAGKPYEFVTLDGEDHWLSRNATRMKMLQTIQTFVEKNNPPG